MPRKRYKKIAVILVPILAFIVVGLIILLLLNNNQNSEEVDTFTTEQSDESIATDNEAAKKYVLELAEDENQKIALELADVGNLMREEKYQEALVAVETFSASYETMSNENKQRYLLVIVQANAKLQNYVESTSALERYLSISDFSDQPASGEYWNKALEQLKSNNNPFIVNDEEEQL